MFALRSHGFASLGTVSDNKNNAEKEKTILFFLYFKWAL